MAQVCSRHRLVGRRTLLASAIAAAGLACAAGAAAHPLYRPDPVDLQVVDRETGQPLRIWRRDGRLYVAGQPGDRYSLRVTNRTEGRVLVVMSVDGVNIMTGETAGYDQRGYIFDPHDTYDLIGWRKSLSEVADFVFAALPQSYAARTGRPENVGVIGIAVFNEKPASIAAEAPPAVAPRYADRGAAGPRRAAPSSPRLALREPRPAPPPAAVPSAAGGADGSSVTELVEAGQKRESRSQSAPVAVSGFTGSQRDVVGVERSAAAAMPSDDKLGTAHGDREYSLMRIVPFERATSYPRFTREIAYDTYDHLLAMGVIPPRYGERQPRPFPSSPGGGFVPDPPDDP